MWGGTVGRATEQCLLSVAFLSVVSCGNPGTPINGMLIGDVFTYQSVVRFQCKEGFRVNGQEEIRCLATAEWSHSIPKCQIVQCEDPGKPANSRRTLTSLIVHSMVTYECIRGYQLVGTRKRTCQPNGQWNGTQPECTGRYSVGPLLVCVQ